MLGKQPLGHLAFKRSRRHRVHRNVAACKPHGQDARHVMHRGLARRIGIRFDVRHLETVYRSDVDDPRRIGVRAGLFEQWKQVAGQEKHRFEIRVHHFIPTLFWKIGDRRTPGCAGVIHQNIELGCVGFDFLHQLRAASRRGDIGGDRDAFAKFRERRRGLVAGLFLAGRNINLHAGSHITFGDHVADAA